MRRLGPSLAVSALLLAACTHGGDRKEPLAEPTIVRLSLAPAASGEALEAQRMDALTGSVDLLFEGLDRGLRRGTLESITTTLDPSCTCNMELLRELETVRAEAGSAPREPSWQVQSTAIAGHVAHVQLRLTGLASPSRVQGPMRLLLPVAPLPRSVDTVWREDPANGAWRFVRVQPA